jgi:protein TonB
LFSSRDLVSFLITSFLYLAGGAALFYASNATEVSDKVSVVKTIELSLNAYQPPEPNVVEKPEPEPVQEEVVEETPLPEPKPELEKVQPLPVEPKQEPKPEPKKEEPKKKPKKIQKKQVKKSVVPCAKKSIKKQHFSAKKRDIFLAKVRSLINKNKVYPRIAKRRGMQGSVRVSFTILPNGNVGNISVSGPRVFHKSTKKAVQKAFPVSVRSIPLSLPKKVSFTMHYRLKS